MFHISSITGTQIPYSTEVFRELQAVSSTTAVSEIGETAESTAAPTVEEIAEEGSSELAAGVLEEETEAAVNEIGSRANWGPAGPELTNYTAMGLAASSLQKTGVNADKETETEAQQTTPRKERKQITETEPIASIHPTEQEPIEIQFPQSHSHHDAAHYYRDASQHQTERKPATTADQIMSSPVQTLGPEDSVQDAWKLIYKTRFRHVPIVNSDGKLVGIMSDRDFIPKPNDTATDFFSPDKKIKDVMATNVLTARPEAEIRLIARIMFQERIGSMPLVNKDGKLVGILTRSDVLRAVVNLAPIEMWT